MIYITYDVPERFRQMTFEELMRGDSVPVDALRMGGKGATHTVLVDRVPRRIMNMTNVPGMIEQLSAFNMMHKDLIEYPNKWDLYDHFSIPKKSGGKMRPIDAPHPALKKALNELKTMLSGWMFADHHTCAYAYVCKRSTVEAVKKHQRFNAWWFAHFDFHGFFPSTTKEFILSQMRVIYPFNLILENKRGAQELDKALSLCMLNGGLPQGTPISPFLTNLMMIPFDHKMAKMLNRFDSGKRNPDGTPITDRICYTRYADDIHISCKVMFNYKKVEREIVALLKELRAPFTLNEEKTRFNSRAGRNWILGIMLNKDNNMTVGYKTHKRFKARMYSYLMDKKNGKKWDYDDLQKFRGTISYYMMIEPQNTAYILRRYKDDFGVDVLESIKDDLNPKAT